MFLVNSTLLMKNLNSSQESVYLLNLKKRFHPTPMDFLFDTGGSISCDQSSVYYLKLNGKEDALDQNGNDRTASLFDGISELKKLTHLILTGFNFSDFIPDLSVLSNLRIIEIIDSKMKKIPSWIGELTKLKEVNLSNNHLTSLPGEISTLVDLTIINLSNNELKEIPRNLLPNKNLRKLNFRGNKIIEFPDILLEFDNLEIVDLSDNPIKIISDNASQLNKKHVQNLVISYHDNDYPTNVDLLSSIPELTLDIRDKIPGLKNLPKWVSWNQNITHLDLTEANYLTIPEDVVSLKNLTSIAWGGSKSDYSAVQSFNPSNFTKLRKLKISNKHVNRLPPWIEQLSLLEVLNIENSGLEYGYSLAYPKNIVELNLQGSKMRDFRVSLKNSPFIEKIDISNTRIGKIPTGKNQTKMRIIKAVRAGLEGINKEIGSYEFLEYLDISENKITSLPKQLGGLYSLRYFNFADNLVNKIPKDFSKLENLEYLNLGNNKIRKLPKELFSLQNLKSIIIEGNELDTLPLEIFEMPSIQFIHGKKFDAYKNKEDIEERVNSSQSKFNLM